MEQIYTLFRILYLIKNDLFIQTFQLTKDMKINRLNENTFIEDKVKSWSLARVILSKITMYNEVAEKAHVITNVRLSYYHELSLRVDYKNKKNDPSANLKIKDWTAPIHHQVIFVFVKSIERTAIGQIVQ